MSETLQSPTVGRWTGKNATGSDVILISGTIISSSVYWNVLSPLLGENFIMNSSETPYCVALSWNTSTAFVSIHYSWFLYNWLWSCSVSVWINNEFNWIQIAINSKISNSISPKFVSMDTVHYGTQLMSCLEHTMNTTKYLIIISGST